MEKVLLSVLVPTYKRYQYLKGCLSSIPRIKSDRFEVIVQDNTVENEEILPFIEGLNDSRIKYFHEVEHVSQSENSDLAMSHATGKYIVMIGDDDSICDCLIDACEFCDKNGIDAANYLIPGFNWPDMQFIGKASEPNFFLDDKADGTVVIQNEKAELEKAIRSAVGLPDTMPRAYHGLTSRACMEAIRAQTGAYFPGPSPDMGNAAAVCLAAKKTAFINDYLIVSGYGYNSARGEGNRKSHYGEIKDKPWLPKDILERWDPEIPRIFSAETIIATSLTESLKRMGRADLASKYNYGVLYALYIRNHRQDLTRVLAFCLKKPTRLFRLARGIVERLHTRHQILKNRVIQPRFFEDMGIDSLETAQDTIARVRRDLGINGLRMADYNR